MPFERNEFPRSPSEFADLILDPFIKEHRVPWVDNSSIERISRELTLAYLSLELWVDLRMKRQFNTELTNIILLLRDVVRPSSFYRTADVVEHLAKSAGLSIVNSPMLKELIYACAKEMIGANEIALRLDQLLR